MAHGCHLCPVYAPAPSSPLLVGLQSLGGAPVSWHLHSLCQGFMKCPGAAVTITNLVASNNRNLVSQFQRPEVQSHSSEGSREGPSLSLWLLWLPSAGCLSPPSVSTCTGSSPLLRLPCPMYRRLSLIYSPSDNPGGLILRSLTSLHLQSKVTVTAPGVRTWTYLSGGHHSPHHRPQSP